MAVPHSRVTDRGITHRKSALRTVGQNEGGHRRRTSRGPQPNACEVHQDAIEGRMAERARRDQIGVSRPRKSLQHRSSHRTRVAPEVRERRRRSHGTVMSSSRDLGNVGRTTALPLM